MLGRQTDRQKHPHTQGPPRLISFLLDLGADPTLGDNAGKMPYELCKEKDCRDAFRRGRLLASTRDVHLKLRETGAAIRRTPPSHAGPRPPRSHDVRGGDSNPRPLLSRSLLLPTRAAFQAALC